MTDATHPDDALAIAWLKVRVEDMSEHRPQWSREAYTHSRVAHIAFSNGQIKVEGEAPEVRSGNVRDLADATLNAIRAYRETIRGPVLLTWRCEPEVRREADDVFVYARLALEPDTLA